MGQSPAYDARDLTDWAYALLRNAGVDPDKARSVARILVEGDLLGHDTHGLALLGPYLTKLDQGEMAGSGDLEVLSDRPGALLWDAGYLPGPWVTERAIQTGMARARSQGTATLAVRRSGHIACLASYLEGPARDGFMVEIHSSDPSVASVAPLGGTRGVVTPNPIAIGIPTSNDPILIDISTSITTNGMSARLAEAGQRFPGDVLLDADGQPSNDPQLLQAAPPGTIQLLGAPHAAHKGYGLTLMVEALTGGLAGHGRADGVDRWGATLMVRITDTSAFAGTDAFLRQIDALTQACLASPATDPDSPVRLPGARGLAHKRAALSNGLVLHETVLGAITSLAQIQDAPLPPAHGPSNPAL